MPMIMQCTTCGSVCETEPERISHYGSTTHEMFKNETLDVRPYQLSPASAGQLFIHNEYIGYVARPPRGETLFVPSRKAFTLTAHQLRMVLGYMESLT